MAGTGKKIAILMESDFYEHEIWYYDFRFKEAEIEVDYLTRLWGQPSIKFEGHELKAPFVVSKSFEGLSDADIATYAAVIVPSGIVSDRLRYVETPGDIPPASAFLKRAFENHDVIKGIICHGLWLVAPITEVVRSRKLVCHNNLYGDAVAYGAIYTNEDVVVDGDLVTGRSGGHAHLFAAKLIELINQR
jgi:deglycase